MNRLDVCDPEIAALIAKEELAQKSQLNFIASENFARTSVLSALGSVLTDVYAEGYPGKRYYAGCTNADAIETLAIERCKQLFSAEHANVQPHSGSQANMAVFFSVLEPGDTIMGLSLAAGGHLTHGHSVNFSGQLYRSIPYTVNPISEYIEYDALHDLAQTHKPKLIIAGGSAYSRIIDLERIQKVAQECGAYLLVDIAHTAGLIATKCYPNPFPYADFVTGTTHKTLRGPRGGFILCKEEHRERIDRSIFPGIQGGPALNTIAGKAISFKKAQTPEFASYIKTALETATAMTRAFEKLGFRIVSGGTDTHLFVIDLSNLNMTGKDAEKLLEKVGILVSRSAIPFDQQKPYIGSGIRLGTLAFTASGFTKMHVQSVVNFIHEVLKNPTNDQILTTIAQQVRDFAHQRTFLSS